MQNIITLNGLSDQHKNIITKTAGLTNPRQLNYMEFIANQTSWQFEVFDAFRSRLKVDELKAGTLAKQALELFYANPDDEVARILVSIELHKWRPVGITIFAHLVEIHQSRNDDAVIKAIEKASTISVEAFKIAYPWITHVTPKIILETVLHIDYSIHLTAEVPETSSTYDGLRKNDVA